jgi:hypothetical protein
MIPSIRSFRWLFVLIMALGTSAARAEVTDDALVEKGLKLRRDRQDAEALALFQQAYAIRAAPRTQAQIALAEQALAKWVEAERDLLTALRASSDPWISSHRETLNKALDAIRKHLGTLSVEANVPDAELWLNDAQAGTLPLEAVRVTAGSVTLEVRAKGYEPVARSVEIAPGGTAKERFELAPTLEPKPLAEPAPNVHPVPGLEPRAAVRSTSSPVAGSIDMRRAFAWGTLGAAGAFLGGAIVAQIMREQNASRYNDDSRCLFGNLSRDERCGVYRGQADSAQGLANIGFVAAGALGAASAILFWSSATAQKTSGVRLGLDIGSTGAELTVRGKL